MFPLSVFPLIGTCVSNGLFGMYDVDEKGAGFVSARNAAVPVGVGPWVR